MLALIAMVSLCLFAYFWMVAGPNWVDSGPHITSALDEYKRIHGQYPATLNSLVPDFIKEIPSAGDDNLWDYGAENGGKSFSLFVLWRKEKGTVVYRSFSSDERRWVDEMGEGY